MRSKTVDIPIYFGSITIIHAASQQEIDKVYNHGFKGVYSGIVWKSDNDFTELFCAFVGDVDNSTIAHECVHLVNHIYISRGIEPDCHNDEPQAYLTGWFFSEIFKFLNEEVRNTSKRKEKS